MVMILQLLCPKRHCLTGVAYDEYTSFEDACATLLGTMATIGYEHRCAICGSTKLTLEEEKSKFSTMEEATPFLIREQAANFATRQYLDATGQTYNQARDN